MKTWERGSNHKSLSGASKNESFLSHSRFGLSKYIFLLFLVCETITVQAVQAPVFSPPVVPQIAPIISEVYPNDTDRNAIDDELEAKAAIAKSRLRSAVTSKDIAEAESVLAETVDVELIFNEQITQKQIDDFLSHGGEIIYVYKAVSYGWNGRIALGSVNSLPGLMSPTLVLVQEAKPVVLHLDTATRTGRVRPVWASGFAGNPSGFDGSNTITIAIVDTGIDAAHSDLSGRQVYWHDFSSDGAASPVDMIGHGSHVSGIALGTGAASGSGTGILYFTDTGDLTGVSSGSFYPYPLGLPATLVTYTSTARWIGGGSTSLYQVYHTKGVSGGWTAISAAASGSSPLTENNTFTGSSSRAYSTALLSNGAMGSFAIANSVTNYPGVGDGFNKLRGVAPGCRWAAAKVFTNSDTGYSTWISAAIDDLVATRVTNNIKVINVSIGITGNPGIDTGLRSKVNTAVNNGVVVVVSAGNDGGASQVDDPGRAAMALTVAASNDEDQLTDYTSTGFSSPGSGEDYKPDIMAPGGSANYHTAILSVDSGSADGAFADQQSNDYASMQGTSMSSPFAAGAVALVIDAMQQQGITWDFGSNQHSRYVKMVLCATASETNTTRENGSYNPTLQRASAGPSGFPAGKDQYEGYGMINPDAAVEAVTLTYTLGSSASDTLGPGTSDRRVWARKAELKQGLAFEPKLEVPTGGDFDLYLYSSTPGTYGTPVILASSIQAGNDVNESFNYTPTADINTLVVVKRVSGSGLFTLTTLPVRILTVTSTAGGTVTQPGIGSFSYASGSVVNLAAAANEHYHFVNWTGSAVTAGKVTDPNAANTTVTMDADYTVQANFAPDQKSLTTSASADGTVTTPGIGTYWYDYNTSANVVASAIEHYHFINWTGTAVTAGKVADPNSANTTVTMDANYTVQANFAPDQMSLTTSASAGGTVTTPGIGTYWYDYNTSASIAASAIANHHFVNWTGSGVVAGKVTNPDSANTTIIMDGDYTVAANFAIDTFTLTYTAGPGGSLTGDTVQVVNYGENGTAVTAVPDTGYQFVNWSDASTDNPRTDLNVTANIAVTANFTAIQFTINASTDSNGTIEPQSAMVNYGASQDFNAIPNIGYEVNEWFLDGNSVQTGGNIYTLSNITTSHIVYVTFKPLMLSISGFIIDEGNMPAEGVLISTDNNDVNSVTDSNGYYRLMVNYGWSGTVTPTKAGFTFTPPSRTYSNVTSNQTNQDYTASVLRTLTISSSAGGNVTTPGEGVYDYNHGDVVNLVATADLNYHFVNWTGTAVDAGKVADANSAATTVTMDGSYTVVANFAINEMTISGYVTEPDANIPVEGVSIDASNDGSSDTTDANGFYELTVAYGWSGTVIPGKTGYAFEPNGIDYNNVTTDQNDNYTAILDTFIIAGYAVDSGLIPLDGVLVSPDNNGGPYTSKYYGGGSDTTDANGYYEVLVDYNWSGKVVPVKYAYIFEPNNIGYVNVTSDYNDQDYTGALLRFIISGHIKNSCDVPIADVLVDANNGGGQDTTDANGFYEVWVDYNWYGTIIPTRKNYTFNPYTREYAGVLNDHIDQDYSADNIYDLDCDGSIGFGDVGVISNNWLVTGENIPGDIYKDENNIVNFLDFSMFAEVWLEN